MAWQHGEAPTTADEVKSWLLERLMKGETTFAAIQSIAENPEESEIRRAGAAAALAKLRQFFE